jgi:hypothetical protein
MRSTDNIQLYSAMVKLWCGIAYRDLAFDEIHFLHYKIIGAPKKFKN